MNWDHTSSPSQADGKIILRWSRVALFLFLISEGQWSYDMWSMLDEAPPLGISLEKRGSAASGLHNVVREAVSVLHGSWQCKSVCNVVGLVLVGLLFNNNLRFRVIQLQQAQETHLDLP